MRVLKVVALSTVVATGVFGLTAFASSAYAQEPFWQGAPNGTGPDEAYQSGWRSWRADTTRMAPRWDGNSSSAKLSGYGLGPGSNGPSSIDNGK